jgi:hypothetical protein
MTIHDTIPSLRPAAPEQAERVKVEVVVERKKSESWNQGCTRTCQGSGVCHPEVARSDPVSAERVVQWFRGVEEQRSGSVGTG